MKLDKSNSLIPPSHGAAAFFLCRSDSILSYSKHLRWALVIGGYSDSYSIDFTVWKGWLQNTCGLNEPCRGWDDIDGECVYFTKFEEGKLDKACKKPTQIICLCMEQVWFLQWECNFSPIRTADLGRRDLEKKKEGYDYCYLFSESSLHHLTPTRRNKSCLGKTAFSPIWT